MSGAKSYGIIIFGLIAVVGLTLSISLVVADDNDEPETQVEDSIVSNLETIDQSPTTVDNQGVASAERRDNGSYQVSGTLVGSFGGGSVIVDSVETTDTEVIVNLGEERPEVGEDVITEYKYSFEVEALDGRTLTVKHEDATHDVANGDTDVSLEVTDRSAGFSEFAQVEEWESNRISIRGGIIGNWSSTTAEIESYEIEGETLTVNVDTGDINATGGGVRMPVLTQVSYRLMITPQDPIQQVTVNHIDGESFDLTENSMSEELTAEIRETSSSPQATSEYAQVSQGDSTSATIRGNIVGTNGGQEVVINDYQNKNGKTYVDVGLEDGDGFATQVITGYQYEIDVQNAEDEIVVLHEGEGVDNEEAIQTGDSQDDLDVELLETESSSASPQEFVRVDRSGSLAKVNGVIVGNTGGQQVVITDYRVDDDETYINIGLERPTDEFVTQVITGYEYNIAVQNPVGDITVLHNGEPVEESNDIIREDK